MVQDTRLRFVYYCSGHGYGHATRVSAVSCHLLSLKPQPIVHIVSSAPQHVFADSIARGARYRNADIDPVIVQPLAYRVDRQKSVEVLRNFLKTKGLKLAQEREWLLNVRADCVLSDTAFLGCLAANSAGIPSVLITNFSFDSVYSYLSTSAVDQDNDAVHQALQAFLMDREIPTQDTPIPTTELEPLVHAIVEGYRCADLLLRLPGAIPIPSFGSFPPLPAPQWVDVRSKTFLPQVSTHLLDPPQSYTLHPSIPFPEGFRPKPTSISRTALSAPLVVRSPDPSVYTKEGRKRVLDSIGVPCYLQDPNYTKILLVSFGGQVFHKPQSRSHSRTSSITASPARTQVFPDGNGSDSIVSGSPNGLGVMVNGVDSVAHAEALSSALHTISSDGPTHAIRAADPQINSIPNGSDDTHISRIHHLHGKAQLQLVVPGAPPAAIHPSPTLPNFSQTLFETITIPPTPDCRDDRKGWIGERTNASEEEDYPQLFPDDSWIAIVCGVSKEWAREGGEELPDNFFVAPKDVYMPDLTAIADVLLGKLGYGTVSECVDSCTPFVFVPRPLFVEEFGLRLLLQTEGAGVELSRDSYECGEWAAAVEEAWKLGRERKAKKRLEGETGKRKQEGKQMAETIVDWVRAWKAAMYG